LDRRRVVETAILNGVSNQGGLLVLIHPHAQTGLRQVDPTGWPSGTSMMRKNRISTLPRTYVIISVF
jgi:hypothetical protein